MCHIHRLCISALLAVSPLLMQAPAVSGTADFPAQWRCETGYRQVDGRCEKISIPRHALSVGNGWKCRSGYRQSDQRCEKFDIPRHAVALGNRWVCLDGYRKTGEQCRKINLPRHAIAIGQL